MARRTIRHKVGNEHNPADPFGRGELVIHPDGSARLDHHFPGARPLLSCDGLPHPSRPPAIPPRWIATSIREIGCEFPNPSRELGDALGDPRGGFPNSPGGFSRWLQRFPPPLESAPPKTGWMPESLVIDVGVEVVGDVAAGVRWEAYGDGEDDPANRRADIYFGLKGGLPG